MANNRNNQGSGFVNFNDILNANQKSGTRMGQAIAGGLQSQGEAVKQNLGQQQQEFQSGLENAQNQWSNTSQLAKQLAEKGGAQDWSGIANNQNSNEAPVDYTTAGENFKNYNYTGPTGLKNINGLQSQAQSATEVGRLAGTSQGQQQLLGQYVGGKGYNQGQSQFDQALLNKYGNNDINQAKKGLVGLGERISGAVSGAKKAGQVEGGLEQAQKIDYRNQLVNALGDKSTGLLGQGANAKNELQNDISQTVKLLKGEIQPSSDKDRELLQNSQMNLEKWGLIPGNVKYYYNPNNTQSVQGFKSQFDNLLNNINLTNAGGNYLLNSDQQTAAQNLNNFLGDTKYDKNQLVDPNKAFNGDVTAATAAINNPYNTLVSNRETELSDLKNLYNKLVTDRNSSYQNLQNSGMGDNLEYTGSVDGKRTPLFNEAEGIMSRYGLDKLYGGLYTNPDFINQIGNTLKAETNRYTKDKSGFKPTTLEDYLSNYRSPEKIKVR